MHQMPSLVRNLIERIVRGEEGQGLVEYGLIITFVSLAAIAGLTVLGSDVAKMFQAIIEKL